MTYARHLKLIIIRISSQKNTIKNSYNLRILSATRALWRINMHVSNAMTQYIIERLYIICVLFYHECCRRVYTRNDARLVDLFYLMANVV